MKLVRPATIADATLASTNILENDYGAWSGATTYALGDRVIVVATNTHQVWESLQAGNLNHTPASSPTWWVLVGATNRWKMFDASVGAQSTRADLIDFTLEFSERINAIGLLNLTAASVQVTATSAADGVVYDQTFDLTSDSGITDWYAYFFEPVVRKTDLFVSDLPPYADLSIRIQVVNTGTTSALGECVAGLSREIGGVQYGATVGIQDYSVKQQDAYGNFSILERAYSKRGQFNVSMDAGITSEVERLLAEYRATPILYVGSDDIDATLIYGFFKDFNISIAFPNTSYCQIEIEGLT